MKKLLCLSLVGALALTCGLTAQAKDVLHLYVAFVTEEAQVYIEAFEKDTGIEVEWVRMSAGEILARVETEASNPQASVWYASPHTTHINAASKGLLEPYKPNLDFELPANMHADDWMWTAFYSGAIGFVSNTEFLKEKGVEPPTSWNDLLNPAFAKNVAIAYPYTSGTSYTTLAGLVQMLGEKEALDWWEKLDKESIMQYTKSGSGCVPMAGLGEVGVGIAFSHDILAKGVNKGYPLVMTFPEDGTSYELGGMALIKGGPEPELGKKFIDWAFTKRAQDLFQQFNRVPVNPNSEVAEGAVTFDEVKLIELDHVEAGLQKDALVRVWRDRIGK